MIKFKTTVSLMTALAFAACQDQNTMTAPPAIPSDDSVTKTNDGTADNHVKITLATPEDGATVTERAIELRGNFTGFKPSYRITATPKPLTGTVRTEGTFVSTYMLDIGDNAVTLKVVDIENDNSTVAAKSLSLRHMPDSPAIGLIPRDAGGEIRVENKKSKIFGAALLIAPKSFDRDIWARLEYYPDQMPNLPENYIAVGPPVSLLPLGETLTTPAKLSLPFSAALMPPEYTQKDIRVLALSDTGWIVLSNKIDGDMSTHITTDKLFYNQYIAVLNKAE